MTEPPAARRWNQHRWNPEDYHIARRKMVEMQIKGRGLNDPRLLAVMQSVPRHFFVEEAQAAQSYADTPLPIGYGQTISQPYIVALMIAALDLAPTDRVLEIGFGSGYQTALLASLAGEVFAVERLEPIFRKGRDNLARLGQANIHLKLDDGTEGWPELAPFGAIIVSAGGPRVPRPLLDQLGPGGRLVIPVGPTAALQKLTLVTKAPPGGTDERRTLGDCRFVALVGRHGWSETP
ncbi:MAG: protein-L-isoaspartate(D-aspartate) O-methyltransferase [Candidatus Adiutrix sp.]|jgi:protein-L-isoaspartate(D-aspartate) O-methyltransferase|nr:protein-L-isoaspartate(D-aspartate) O-methyltransferase [Candidatus Adiutrix sp.]